MNRIMQIFISFIILCFTTFAFANTQQQAYKAVNAWFKGMATKKYSTVAALMSPKFMSMHTDNIARNKAQEMQLIRHLNFHDYDITHFKISQSGNTIITTYLLQTHEMIDGEKFSSQPMGRMTVLQQLPQGKLLILAHANLDIPQNCVIKKASI